MNQFSTRVLGMLAFISLWMAGCSSPSMSFLGDTSNFAADSNFGGALVYRHPTKAGKDYAKVWLDSAEVHFANPSSTGDADPKAMQEFIAFWRGEVEKHLKDRNFALAQGPGESTLRVRMALTGVRPAKQSQLFTATVLPGRLDIGSATFEAEALDSNTRERIFAIIDQSATHRPTGADQLEYAKSAIKEWTARLFAAR